MRVVVGLGNPGNAYARTRHNLGFMVVEELARRWRVTLFQADSAARSACVRIDGETVELVQPMRYMNLSGEVLAALYPVPGLRTLIVVHDDIDLESGCVRVKCGGGTAGHQGLESIVAQFGEQFTRVRIGVGRPPRGQDAANFVLSTFDAAEQEAMQVAIDRAADAVECILRKGEQTAMNVFNRRVESTAAPVAAPNGRE